MTTRERFDGITIDPLDPWVKGAASFYTREFLETLKQHLNPGGTVTLYVQLFETDLEAVKSASQHSSKCFPNGTIWGNPYQGQGHDMILLGQAEPLRINLDEMEQRIGYRGGNSPVAMSLAEIGMNSPVDLFATYAGRRSDLTEWLRGASINHDWNLRMQYLAGLGLDRDDAASIYAGMLALSALSRGSLLQRGRKSGLVTRGYSPPPLIAHALFQPSRQARAYKAEGLRSRISPLEPLKMIGKSRSVGGA